VARKIIGLSLVFAFGALADWLYHQSRLGTVAQPLTVALAAGVFTLAIAARFPE
jgi:hypothetical protein